MLAMARWALRRFVQPLPDGADDQRERVVDRVADAREAFKKISRSTRAVVVNTAVRRTFIYSTGEQWPLTDRDERDGGSNE